MKGVDEMDVDKRFNEAKDVTDLFSLVKEGVEKVLGARRAGLMLGLSEMGASPAGFIGAYYPVDSNMIVLNKTPIRALEKSDKKLVKPFVFHLLLHEYLHSLGMYDELETRKATYWVSKTLFGDSHIITDLAAHPENYMPKLQYGIPEGQSDASGIEIINGFDEESRRFYS